MISKPLVIATHNSHKYRELSSMLKGHVEDVQPLPPSLPSPEETEDSLEGNAELKAIYFYTHLRTPVLSDDSGLFVPAFDGKPGVHTARWASKGPQNAIDRIHAATPLPTSAFFRSVLCYYAGSKAHFFEAKLEGTLYAHPKGTHHMSFDAYFVPTGDVRSIAEMSLEEKCAISPRSIALQKFIRIYANQF